MRLVGDAQVSGPLAAAWWGLVTGSALLSGALVGYFVKLPQRLIAGVMAFGSGVLISALSSELMDEAYKHGGILSVALGFLAGALLYTSVTGSRRPMGPSTGNDQATSNLPSRTTRAAG